jgi:hypothetical protein
MHGITASMIANLEMTTSAPSKSKASMPAQIVHHPPAPQSQHG